MNIRQQRLQFGGFNLDFGFVTGLAPDKLCSTGALRIFSGQQPFDIAVAGDEMRDLMAHLLHKFRAEMNIVTQVVHPELQSLQREGGSITTQGRRRNFFRALPKSE